MFKYTYFFLKKLNKTTLNVLNVEYINFVCNKRYVEKMLELDISAKFVKLVFLKQPFC